MWTVISWQSASIDQVYWWGAGSVSVVCRQCDCGVLAVCQVLSWGLLRIWCDIFIGSMPVLSMPVVCGQCDWCPGNVPVLIGGVFQNVTVISWQYCIYVGGVLVFVVSIAP